MLGSSSIFHGTSLKHQGLFHASQQHAHRTLQKKNNCCKYDLCMDLYLGMDEELTESLWAGIKEREEHLENVIVELQYRAPDQEEFQPPWQLQEEQHRAEGEHYRRSDTEHMRGWWGIWSSTLSAMTMNVEVNILSAARMHNTFTTLDSRRADFVPFIDHGIKLWRE